MSRLSRDRMPYLLGLLCFVLILVALLFAFNIFTGIFALLDAGMDKTMAVFIVGQLAGAFLAVVPLLVFVRLVHAVITAKEFFSRSQSRRVLVIAVCFFSRVVMDLLTPSIEVPALLNGAIGSMSIGPSLNLTLLAISLMFLALAGVFEYGRKLQEDSDNIL